MKTMHRHTIPLKFGSKIIQKSSSDRIYKNVVLLTSGDWSDSITNAPVRYSNEILKKYSKNWIQNFINLDHSFETLKRKGWIENTYFKDTKLMGDIRISTTTPNGKAAVAHIDAGLVNGLSVEVMREDEWDSIERVRLADKLDFIGAAITIIPACDSSKIK